MSAVLLIGVLPSDPAARMTAAQFRLLSPIALVGGCMMALALNEIVLYGTDVLRFASLAVAAAALFKAEWAYVPPLLVLALAFHADHWVAHGLSAGKSPREMWRDLRSRVSRLGRPPG